MDWTIVLSGPLNMQGPLLKALERAGCGLQDQPEIHPEHGLDASDPTVAFVTALHADVNHVADIGAKHKYALRQHWPTPRCRVCSGHTVRNGVACTHCLGVGLTNRLPVALDAVDVHALLARVVELERAVGRGA